MNYTKEILFNWSAENMGGKLLVDQFLVYWSKYIIADAYKKGEIAFVVLGLLSVYCVVHYTNILIPLSITQDMLL